MSIPPPEFLGKARALREEVRSEDSPATKRIDTIVRRLYERAKRYPSRSPRRADLIDASRAWRETLPTGARLALNATVVGRELAVDELRVAAIDFRFQSWSADEFEPALALFHVRLRVAARRCDLEAGIVAAVSIHGLARRYQRGFNTTREAVLNDVAALAAVPEVVDTDERVVVVPGGRWVGTIATLIHGQRTEKILAARTFI
jgi:hypothetical protein